MLLLKDDGLLKIVPSWNFENGYFINRRLFDFQNLVNTLRRIVWCALGKFLLHVRIICRCCNHFFVLLFCINLTTFLGSFLRRYSSNRSKCIEFWLCGIVLKNWDLLKFWINFHVTLFWLFLRNELYNFRVLGHSCYWKWTVVLIFCLICLSFNLLSHMLKILSYWLKARFALIRRWSSRNISSSELNICPFQFVQGNFNKEALILVLLLHFIG